jgi:outer membrane biosynthesis protein TonB
VGRRTAAVAANRGSVEYGTDVVTPDDASGREPIDPVFAGLFRPEDLDPVESQPEPTDVPEPVDEPVDEPEPEPVDETADEPEPEPAGAADAPEPVPAAADVDTGRLFRSQGVIGESAAVLALTSDHGGTPAHPRARAVRPPARGGPRRAPPRC